MTTDILCAASIREARQYRALGVRLDVSLGMLKLYRQSYVDLIGEKASLESDRAIQRTFIELSFDCMEVALCREWDRGGQDELIQTLQTSIQSITNERNAYFTVFEGLADPIIMLDEHNAILNLNYAASRLVDSDYVSGARGSATGDGSANQVTINDPRTQANLTLTGRDLFDVFPWLPPELIIEQTYSTVSRLTEIETTLQGETRYFEVRMSHLVDVGERTTASVLLLRDTTEHRNARQAVIDSEKRFRTVVNSVYDAIFLHELDGTLIDVNDSMLKLYGVTREEATRLSIADDYSGPAAARASLPETWQRVFSGVPQFFEWQARRPHDGTLFDVEVYLRRIPFLDRDIVLANVRDITERKQAEAARRESEQRYKSMFENNHAVMLIIDPESGDVVDANPAAAAYYEYSREQLKTMKVWEINTLGPEQLRQEMKQAGARNRRQFFFRHRLASGEERDVEVFAGPIIMQGRQLLYSIVHDITERKSAEQRLNRTMESLEQSNAALDQFAYITSHDLKAPLRAISNLSRWLKEDLREHLDGDAARNMELLTGRVKRMERMIDDILLYSRIGRTYIDTEVVDTSVLLGQVVDLLNPPARFAVTVQRTLPVITTARTPLHQVLHNLIGNAIKHHHRDEGKVVISADDEGAYYRFRVTDDGPGIPEEYHERVFGMFQTLKSRDEVEGSGVGLAVIRKQVESARGEIRLISAPGKGTTFEFTWPKVWEKEELTCLTAAQ